VCEADHGCAPIPITRAMIGALQRTDSDACAPTPLSPQDAQALEQLKQLLNARAVRPGARKSIGHDSLELTRHAERYTKRQGGLPDSRWPGVPRSVRAGRSRDGTNLMGFDVPALARTCGGRRMRRPDGWLLVSLCLWRVGRDGALDRRGGAPRVRCRRGLIAEIRRDGGALHVGEVVRLSAAEVNDTQAKFSWRLVSRPEDSRAKLSDHTKGTTVVRGRRARRPSLCSMTVQVRSERAHGHTATDADRRPLPLCSCP
jgi:hypothetical protein